MILSELYDGTIKQTEVGKIAFDEAYDVVICGLGTAGAMAAIFAADSGSDSTARIFSERSSAMFHHLPEIMRYISSLLSLPAARIKPSA